MLKLLSKWIVSRKHFDIVYKKLQITEQTIIDNNKLIYKLQKAKKIYRDILVNMNLKDIDKPFVTIIDETKNKKKKIYRINK